MKSLTHILDLLAQEKARLRQFYHVDRIGIFGSVARGEATEASDVDILLEFSKPIGWDMITLADELEALLENRVDAIPRDAIRPRMWPYIQKDLIYV